MKANVKYCYKLLIALFVFFSAQKINAQFVDGYGMWEHWYLSGNIGISSFVGDLSHYDYDPFNKLNHESKLSINGILAKEISPILACRGQFIYGALKGEKGNAAFNTNFLETSALLTVNMSRLFLNLYSEPKSYYYVYFGLGLIQFRAIERDINTNEFINAEGYDENINPVTPGTGSMVIAGAMMRRKINERLDFNIDVSIHPSTSDELDAQSGGSLKYDMFTYVSAGLTYKIVKLYPLWHPQLTKKYKASRRHWSRHQSVFYHRKRGGRNLGSTFAILRY